MSTKYRRVSYAVWEITLKCNLACSHCGSRAGQARTKELSTEEALDVVRQLAEVGIKEVTLIGGEAFMRPDWLEIANAITQAGMLCGMTTGGFGISLETARRMKQAGIGSVLVSVDGGKPETHDRLCGKEGAWKSAFRTMSDLRDVGIRFGCNTQINRLSAPEFPLIYEQIRDAGAQAWQIQLTVPMGNAADNADILLQPYELLDHIPFLTQHHINQIAILIHSSIEVTPRSFDSEVSFIDKPDVTQSASTLGSQLLSKEWGKTLLPMTHCFMAQDKTPQQEEFCNIPIAQLVA